MKIWDWSACYQKLAGTKRKSSGKFATVFVVPIGLGTASVGPKDEVMKLAYVLPKVGRHISKVVHQVWAGSAVPMRPGPSAREG